MRLFIVEGIDGAGKTTQVARLCQRFAEENRPCRQIKLPNYGYAACEPVKLYLAGEFGTDADAVNAYAASSFFAVDRFAYYRKFWREDYLSGKIILSDRYVSSNLIHQCVKLPVDQRDAYINWLYDFEYEKMGIPRPDAVFYLDVSPQITERMMSRRYGGDEGKKDIHERNEEYLQRCYEMGLICCEKYGFERIPCTDAAGNLLPIDVINDELYRRINAHCAENGGN